MVTRDRLLEGLEGLVGTIPNAKMPTEPGLKMWLLSLNDMPDDLFLEAVVAWVRRGEKFMPTPGALLELTRGSAPDQAELLWGFVEKSMRTIGHTQSVRFHPAANAAIRSMGGWVKLCRGNEDELHFRRLEFLKAVQTYLRANLPEGEHLCGIEEMDHLAKLGRYEGEIRRVGPGSSPVVVHLHAGNRPSRQQRGPSIHDTVKQIVASKDIDGGKK